MIIVKKRVLTVVAFAIVAFAFALPAQAASLSHGACDGVGWSSQGTHWSGSSTTLTYGTNCNVILSYSWYDTNFGTWEYGGLYQTTNASLTKGVGWSAPIQGNHTLKDNGVAGSDNATSQS